jgi:2-amino-4-hydroxy-6-hydroxymethyldihydropteridine diphosphokinase
MGILAVLAKHTVYLSLGSNLGDRMGNLGEAMRRLAELGTVLACSSFYETEPVDVMEEQPWYANCAIAMETELTPSEFLARMLAIEQAMGRQRTHAKSPRTIDIDIVLFGDLKIEDPELTIPHPGMRQRRFVLEPLAELAPGVVDPVSGKTAREMLAELPADGGAVRRVSAG